jgi:hypothetical protein
LCPVPKDKEKGTKKRKEKENEVEEGVKRRKGTGEQSDA